MNKLIKFLCSCVVAIYVFIFQSTLVFAEVMTVEDLKNQEQLTISIGVNQNEQQIVGQALILSIEVATDRWFAKGSRVKLPQLADIVMQANGITTINGSKRIQGKTWATQTHEVVLYPTTYGDYLIPPINVDVSVNTENDGIVSGTLTTKQVSFNIKLPNELKGIDNFIVSSEVTVDIDGEFNSDINYVVGDAITQTITITADDTPGMMIAPINLTSNTPFESGEVNDVSGINTTDLATTGVKVNDKLTLDGVSIYHKPAQVFDKSNRGTLTGTRIESYTYIFEKPGSYVIDEQILYWWNTQTNTLERLVIPSSSWTVSGGSLTSKISTVRFKNFKLNLQTVIAISTGILVLFLGYIGFIKRHGLASFYKKITKYEQRKIRSNFLNAVIKQDYLAATQYLYQYDLLTNKTVMNKIIVNKLIVNKAIVDSELESNKVNTEIESCSLTSKLNQLAFSHSIEGHSNDTTYNKALSFSIDDAKALIKQIDILRKGNIAKKSYFTPNEPIELTF